MNFQDVSFPAAETGWATGNNKIVCTTNGGENWTDQSTGNSTVHNAFYFINALTGWVCGSTGTIFKTTNGGMTFIPSIVNTTIPQKYLLFQNYPNPFNPLTTIGFQCSEFKEVSLKVYDILGREIAVIVNEPLAPGTYEVKFDGSRISSGMYFYRLHTNNYTETKKMSLLK